MLEFIDKDPTSSDSRDLHGIATEFFPGPYLAAQNEKRVHAEYLKRKKAGKK
jgi:hypothetical protein